MKRKRAVVQKARGPALSHSDACRALVDGLQRLIDGAHHLVDRAQSNSKGIERRTSIALTVETDVDHGAPQKTDSLSTKSYYVHTMSASALQEAARSKKVMLIECSDMIDAMTEEPTVSEGVYAMPQDHWNPPWAGDVGQSACRQGAWDSRQ